MKFVPHAVSRVVSNMIDIVVHKFPTHIEPTIAVFQLSEIVVGRQPSQRRHRELFLPRLQDKGAFFIIYRGIKRYVSFWN